MSVKLENDIFDKAKRLEAFSGFVSRSTKEFKQLTKDNMSFSSSTGRTYPRGSGEAFRRYHRASARGERPSPDTTTLVNAISDRRLSKFSSEVYVEDLINPLNGTLASDYVEILQNTLDRPVMSSDDVNEAQERFTLEANKLITDLISKR